MSSKKFPPSNADQVLCKQNQLRHLQKQKEEWFRQRRAVEGFSDVASNHPASEREVVYTQNIGRAPPPVSSKQTAQPEAEVGTNTLLTRPGSASRPDYKNVSSKVACWSKSELKKKEQAELRELQKMADELRQERDVLMGRQASASKERHPSEEFHVHERDEDLERAIAASLADNRLSVDQQEELDLERQPEQIRGTANRKAQQRRSNTKAHFTKETTIIDDIDGMDEELEEMNDFLMAVDLQCQQQLI